MVSRLTQSSVSRVTRVSLKSRVGTFYKHASVFLKANVKVQIMTTKVPHPVFNKVTFKVNKKMTSLVRL